MNMGHGAAIGGRGARFRRDRLGEDAMRVRRACGWNAVVVAVFWGAGIAYAHPSEVEHPWKVTVSRSGGFAGGVTSAIQFLRGHPWSGGLGDRSICLSGRAATLPRPAPTTQRRAAT